MKETLYLKVYKDLRDKIIGGGYKYGQKLPSKRTVAAAFGVSVITAERAYELLSSEGYVTAREKSGYFCAFRKGDTFLSAAAKSESAVFKSSDYKSDFPFGIYAKTVRKILSEAGENLLKKSENGGTAVLKNAIACYLLRSRGVRVSPNQIVVGAGAEYLYGIIIETLGANFTYAIENPSYRQIEKVYKIKGVNYELLPLSTDGIDTRSLFSSKADILHITPFRRLKNGNSASVSKRAEYLRWVSQKNRFIIEDDFESEFSESLKMPDTVFAMSGGKRVIYLNTFSKTVSPAVRVAYAVFPVDLTKQFNEKVGFYSCTVPVLEQYVLTSLLENGDFERHINRVRRNLKNEK